MVKSGQEIVKGIKTGQKPSKNGKKVIKNWSLY